MKKHYKKVVQEKYFNPYQGEWLDRWHPSYVGKYRIRYGYSYRYVRTFNEIKQNRWAIDDGYHVRGKRSKRNIPTVYEDIRIGRSWKYSWKDFTKYDKQYKKNLM